MTRARIIANYGDGISIAETGTGETTAAATASALGLGTEDSPTFTGLKVDGTSPLFTIKASDEAGTAGIQFEADQADDNADLARITVNQSGLLEISGYGTGSWVTHLAKDSTGKVGIGTNTPSSCLELAVNGNDNTLLQISNYSETTNQARLYFQTSKHATIGSHTLIPAGTDIGMIDFNGSDGSNFVLGARIKGTADEAFSGSGRGTYLSFHTVDNASTALDERMRIDHNGNVGIGIAGPESNLHIKNTSGSGTMKIESTSADAIISLDSYGANNAAVIFHETGVEKARLYMEGGNESLRFKTAGTDRLTILSSGKVGIGTTAPSTNLQLLSATTAEPNIRLSNSNTDAAGPALILEKTGASSTQASGDVLGQISFHAKDDAENDTEYANIQTQMTDNTNGNEDGRMYFKTMVAGTLSDSMVIKDGKVGIGTTDPRSLLMVKTDSLTNIDSSILLIENSGDGSILAGTGAGMTFIVGDTHQGPSNAGFIWGQQTGEGVSWVTDVALCFRADNVAPTTTNAHLTIRGDGKVGIGTTTVFVDSSFVQIEKAKTLSGGRPQNQLSVSDSTAMAAEVGGAISFAGNYQSGTDAKVTYASIEGVKENATNSTYDGKLIFKTRLNGGDNRQHMTILSSGKVGIGTTTPLHPLTVASDHSVATNSWDAENIAIQNTVDSDNTHAGIGWHDSNATQVAQIMVKFTSQSNNSADMFFVTRPASGSITTAERMRITSTGYVGIGTSTPFTGANITPTPGLEISGTQPVLLLNDTGGDRFRFYVNETTGLHIGSDSNQFNSLNVTSAGRVEFSYGITGGKPDNTNYGFPYQTTSATLGDHKGEPFLGNLTSTYHAYKVISTPALVNATAIIINKWYKISTPGNTDWTVFSAANSDVDTIFKADENGDSGSGTGVAILIEEAFKFEFNGNIWQSYWAIKFLCHAAGSSGAVASEQEFWISGGRSSGSSSAVSTQDYNEIVGDTEGNQHASFSTDPWLVTSVNNTDFTVNFIHTGGATGIQLHLTPVFMTGGPKFSIIPQ